MMGSIFPAFFVTNCEMCRFDPVPVPGGRDSRRMTDLAKAEEFIARIESQLKQSE